MTLTMSAPNGLLLDQDDPYEPHCERCGRLIPVLYRSLRFCSSKCQKVMWNRRALAAGTHIHTRTGAIVRVGQS